MSPRKERMGPGSAQRHEECRSASGTRASTHPEKITLADLDAVVTQDAVGGGGVEVKIRKRKMTEELLTLQRHGAVRAGGKFDVARLDPLELFGLVALDIVDGVGQPLLQFGKTLFGVRRRP